MSVGELIEKLSTYPLSADVYTYVGDGLYDKIRVVKDVRLATRSGDGPRAEETASQDADSISIFSVVVDSKAREPNE